MGVGADHQAKIGIGTKKFKQPRIVFQMLLHRFCFRSCLGKKTFYFCRVAG